MQLSRHSRGWTKCAKRDLIHHVQPLISIHEAEDLILSQLPVLDWEETGLEHAYGRVLAETISADRPIPPYDRVMMDGVAISYQSFAAGRREFTITGTQAAGSPALTLENKDQCLEVMTGAVLPDGCDCVIKIEDIRLENGVAHLSPSCPASPGQHIHPAGSDQEKGSPLVSGGSILSAPELAIAASVGKTQILLVRQPNILLITTGDEVIPPDEQPRPHQIRRSHAPAIKASIESKQLGNVTNVHVSDTKEDLEKAISEGLEDFDIILLTGGISMGKFDYVAPVLDSLVGTPSFHGVAQRPGKPFAFWPGKTPVFALPGNPVSVMACLARYVLPALRHMRRETWNPQTLPLAHETIWNAPFPGLVASNVFDNQLHPSPPRNSGDYSALAGAQGICELPSSSPASTTLPFYPW
ncbi:molybdopterin molybdenumtransferase MoeA [Oceaniferula spumae]|uniref:Molybdopterin molybdenumtransferase n=1 Tax=Oceaniferula spumae TaxID=2979115 RepID=A0AAT9FPN7_9BACT